MEREYELVILGGGCAGLSLAARLAELGPRCPRTLIVERRTEYTNDRTWCCWDDGAARTRSLAAYRWKTMRMRGGGRAVDVDCGATPYQMIPAAAFYRDALERLRKNAAIHLCLGSTLLREARRTGTGWAIETNRGRCAAATVIDTRPGSAPAREGATLWQSFAGDEIECDEPVFDPLRMELMDFDGGGTGRILFTYVLPVSPRRALVEVTLFGSEPVAGEGLREQLAAAIERKTGGAPYRVLRSEHGILPMGTRRAAKGTDSHYVHAGLNSGGARACTGYAFQRIQRWADVCASRIGAGQLPVGHASDPPLLRAMDHIFLSVLRARPERAADVFLSLFEKTPSERILRFLSDHGGVVDALHVIRALPMWLFIRELPAVIGKQLFTRSEAGQ